MWIPLKQCNIIYNVKGHKRYLKRYQCKYIQSVKSVQMQSVQINLKTMYIKPKSLQFEIQSIDISDNLIKCLFEAINQSKISKPSSNT